MHYVSKHVYKHPHFQEIFVLIAFAKSHYLNVHMQLSRGIKIFNVYY